MAKKIKLPKKKTKEKLHFFDYNDTPSLGEIKSTHIELFSNKRALVERCKGVFEYNDTLVKLNLGGKSGIFIGKNLKITSLEGKNLVITGEIETINFLD